MGDRANIFVIDQPLSDNPVNGIYLYTHWEGYVWPEILRLALHHTDARGRWNDDSYLTRIVIREVFESLTGATGGGVSTYLTDNEHEIIVLNIPGQFVAFASPGEETDPGKWYGALSFSEYCDQVEALYPERQETVGDHYASDVIDAEVIETDQKEITA